MDITKIVITGGPCGGKSTAMTWIQESFTQKGYAVLFVPETATELITGGVAPWTCKSNVEFQKCQMKLQLEKEKVFEQAASVMNNDKILIVCDRGAIDNKAYMNDPEFSEVLDHLDINEVMLRDSYDAVFHLVTAAKGAEEYYTNANNTARTETVEEAAVLDDKVIAAWTGHPHLRMIDNSTNFELKMKRLLAEISAFLGEPEPLEIERKFLIEYPDIEWLDNYPFCTRAEIIQTYLNSAERDEIRIRQRGIDGNYTYSHTLKRKVDDKKRIEIEHRLSKDDYIRSLMEADTNKHQIRKTRYCISYMNQYLEIDVYPFWKDKAILEVELSREDAPIDLPKEIKIIKEVTADENYKNRSLASREV